MNERFTLKQISIMATKVQVTAPSQHDAKLPVVRSASEIELRLKNLKLDQADCKKWYEDAYAKYESDRKYWGRGEADPTEYLEANRQLVELNVQIMQLEWVLGLRP
jgi:hypothetical protein